MATKRFTRVSEHELNYVFTVSDPSFYSRPWTGETHLLRSSTRMFEDACHEGNYSLRNVLEAARTRLTVQYDAAGRLSTCLDATLM